MEISIYICVSPRAAWAQIWQINSIAMRMPAYVCKLMNTENHTYKTCNKYVKRYKTYLKSNLTENLMQMCIQLSCHKQLEFTDDESSLSLTKDLIANICKTV